MLVYIQMQSWVQFGTESFFQKILIQHFKYSEKPLAVHSFLLIPQKTLIHTFPKQTIMIHLVLDYKLLNLTPLFTPSLSADAFITLFGYPCYIFTQCGIYFTTIFTPSRFTDAFITLFGYPCYILTQCGIFCLQF